ncbi:MAG: hypothetical protein CBB71_13415 [Rhodopirellula sp. TMED11]|nr:MAG: hypothetical protein CBB71_13415 [Rhodopirellula sp. TMED11]
MNKKPIRATPGSVQPQQIAIRSRLPGEQLQKKRGSPWTAPLKISFEIVEIFFGFLFVFLETKPKPA